MVWLCCKGTDTVAYNHHERQPPTVYDRHQSNNNANVPNTVSYNNVTTYNNNELTGSMREYQRLQRLEAAEKRQREEEHKGGITHERVKAMKDKYKYDKDNNINLKNNNNYNMNPNMYN
eukprot:GHVR01165533.1.p1 GENE.GHVR01165533.1~~GHVR01165533.1.p1  ORF type:complete len:119 (+),score=45.27 GHVR01165533.1:57-413(+)